MGTAISSATSEVGRVVEETPAEDQSGDVDDDEQPVADSEAWLAVGGVRCGWGW